MVPKLLESSASGLTLQGEVLKPAVGAFKSGSGVFSPWKLVSLGYIIPILPLLPFLWLALADTLCVCMWSTAISHLCSCAVSNLPLPGEDFPVALCPRYIVNYSTSEKRDSADVVIRWSP